MSSAADITCRKNQGGALGKRKNEEEPDAFNVVGGDSGILINGGMICWVAVEESVAAPDLAYYQPANINWLQFEGQKLLTIRLNKPPYTASLLLLVPEFEALTVA